MPNVASSTPSRRKPNRWFTGGLFAKALLVLATAVLPRSVRAQTCGFTDPACGANKAPVVSISPASATVSTSPVTLQIEMSDDFKLDSTSFRVYRDGSQISAPYNRNAAINWLAWSQVSVGFSAAGSSTIAVHICDNQNTCSDVSTTVTYSPPPAQSNPVVALTPHHNFLRPASPCAGCASAFAVASPAYLTRDVPQSLALQYSSAAAAPVGLVMLDVTMTSASNPTTLALRLKKAGGVYRTLTAGDSATGTVYYGASATRTTRIAAQFDAGTDTTGVYTDTAEVTAIYADNSTTTTLVAINAMILNERQSRLGVGVVWAGIPRMYTVPNGLLLQPGDGSLLYYVGTGCNLVSCAYTSPEGTWGTLTKDASNSWGGVLTGRDGTVISFDGRGHPWRYKNRFGDTTKFAWNGDSLTSVTDVAGRQITLGYSGTGVGSLATITDGPGSRTTTVLRNGSHQITGVVLSTGDSVLRRLTYDASHRVLTAVGALGDSTKYTYDALGWLKLAMRATPGGAVVATDSVWSLPTVMQPAAGRGVSVATADPGLVPDSAWTTVKGPTGVRQRVRADRFGLPLVTQSLTPTGQVLTSRWDRNSSGLLTSSRDARGSNTRTTYLAGTPLADTVEQGGQRQTYTYTTYDQPLTISVDATVLTQYYYHGAALTPDSVKTQGATTKFVWNAQGRATTITAPNNQNTTYTYQSTGAQNTLGVSLPSGTTTYGFDAVGRTTSVRDPLNHKDSTSFDALNRATRLEVPGQVNTVGYVTSTRTQTVTDAKSQVYTSRVDALGRPQAEVDPRGNRDSVAYSATGQVVTAVNRASQSIVSYADALGRDTLRVAGTDTTRFGFDPASTSNGGPALTWVFARNANSLDTAWTDGEGRPSTIRYRRSNRRYDIRWAYGPDWQGLRQLTWGDAPALADSASFTARGTQSFWYDGPNGRLGGLQPTGTSRGTKVNYNSAGQLLRLIFPKLSTDSVVATFAFTPNQQLSSVAYGPAALDSVYGRLYAFDLDGRHSVMQRGSNYNSTIRTFAYDSAGRLRVWADSTHVYTQQWDCLEYDNFLCISWGYLPGTWQHTRVRGDTNTYDAVGNITNHSATIGTGNRLTAFNGYTLTYDSTGNLRTKSKAGYSQTLYWSALGLLDSVVTNGQTTKFQYNAAGLRIRKTTATADINYVLNGAQVLAETERSTNALLREYQYYPGADRPHAVRLASTGKTYFYLYEEPGNVIALLDTTGAVVNSYAYEPFGKATSGTVAVPQPFQFASRELDAETGLYYNRARYYDPELMRFISEDPTGLAGGINRYAYVSNDPANAVDPSGLCPVRDLVVVLHIGSYDVECSTDGSSSSIVRQFSGQLLPTITITAIAPNEFMNTAKLAELTPAFRSQVEQMLLYAQQRGVVMRIVTAYRKPSDQLVQKAMGNSGADPCTSWHQYYNAADLEIVGDPGRGSLPREIWDDRVDNLMITLSAKFGLGWGGLFRKLYDPYHVQRPSENVVPSAAMVRACLADWR